MGSKPARAARRADREVIAYALRWDAESLAFTTAGEPRWCRTTAGCLDEWLNAYRPRAASDPVPVLLNHGRLPGTDKPSDILAEPVGHFRRLDADHIGLRTTAVFGTSGLAERTLAAIRDGTLTAYSVRLRVTDTAETGRTRDGLPVCDITRAELVEAGPADNPADPGAVIVAAAGHQLRTAAPVHSGQPIAHGSMEDALAYLESVTGLHLTADDIRDRHAAEHRAARQTVRDIEGLAIALARTRRDADSAYRAWRSPWTLPDDFTRYRELETYADQLDAELRDALCNDPGLYRQICTTWSVPPKVSMTQRLRDSARAS